jgi:hypothetical protein
MVDYYYNRDGQKHGPFAPDQIKQLVVQGQLRPDDLLWKEGWDTWQKAGEVKGLFAKPATVGPPAPPLPVPPVPGPVAPAGGPQ